MNQKNIGIIIVSALATILVNFVVVRQFELEANFSETGYHSNLARMVSADRESTSAVVLAGSSITGRILPNYFADHGIEAVNLGMDGGGGASGIEAFLATNRQAMLLVVETNTLAGFPSKFGLVSIEARNLPWYQLQRKIPAIQPQYRPSSVFYSLSKRVSDRGGRTLRDGEIQQNPTALERDYIQSLLNDLSQRADQILFVNFPSKVQTREDLKGVLEGVCHSHPHMDQLDLVEKVDMAGLKFTDGVHLTRGSAKTVSDLLVRELEARYPTLIRTQ